jgi:hypothetical protein
MKKFLVASAVVAAMVVLGAFKSSAQIATWDVAGTGTPFLSSLVAGTSDGFLASVPSLTRGGGLLGNSAGSSFANTNWNNTATFNKDLSYMTFTVAATGGYQLNLTDLKYSINGSNTLPNQGQWGYSLDGGATFTMQPIFATSNIQLTSLSTWDFADFTTPNTVEFRFWAWGTVSASGAIGASSGSGRINNIAGSDLVLDGTTSAVPEPSTLSLIGFGILGMLAFSRRRFSRS